MSSELENAVRRGGTARRDGAAAGARRDGRRATQWRAGGERAWWGGVQK